MKHIQQKITYSTLLSMILIAMSGQSSYAVNAQEIEETVVLPTVTVTATRTLQDIAQTPSSISVITAKDIDNRAVDTVTEALQLLPGVYKSQASTGELQVRGFDSKNISVLVDGIPMNNTFNNKVDWEVIPVHSIERIELVRGASSSLYGGKSVAGVISITTKQMPPKAGSKEIRWHGKVNGGTYGTWNNELGFDARVSDRVSIGVSAEERRTKGFPGFFVATEAKDINPKKKPSNLLTPDTALTQLHKGKYILGNRGDKSLDTKNISSYITFDVGDKQVLTYRYTHANHKYSYNNATTLVNVNNQPTFSGNVKVGGTKYVSLNGMLGHEAELEYQSHNLQYKNEANKLQISLGFLDKKKDGYSEPTSPNASNYEGRGTYSFYPGKAYHLDTQKAWKPQGKHQLVGGLNWKQESFDQSILELKHWRDKKSVDSKTIPNGVKETNTGSSRNIAVFVQDTYRPNDDWAVYAGFRLDRFKKYNGSHGEYNTKTKAYEAAHHNDESYTEISPKLSIERYLNDSVNVYASYGHSFAPPTLYQVYRGKSNDSNIHANPELKPEHSDTFEIGIKKEWNDNSYLNLSAFYVNTKDKIQYVTFKKTNCDDDYKKYLNVGTEVRRGVEVEVSHRFSPKWSLFGNYTWELGEIDSPVIANTKLSSGKAWNYTIPKHLFHGGIEYNSGKWNAVWDMQYVSARQASSIATGEPDSEDAYFLHNAYVNYKVSKEATLQFGVQNIFDREYYAKEATAGRTYNVGMKLKF